MKRIHLFMAATFAIVSVPCVRAEDTRYTLKDLQALDQRHATNELLAHLQDVPPSQRTADYDLVVKHACLPTEGLDEDVAPYCLEPLQSVLAAAPNDRDFAWKAGKWVHVNLASWTAAPFFAAALVTPDDARCQDKDVTEAIVSGMEQSAQTQKAVVAASQKLAFDVCWPAPKAALIEGLNNGASDFQANSCAGLKKKNALSNLQTKRCAAK
jgi:hypothetical protein